MVIVINNNSSRSSVNNFIITESLNEGNVRAKVKKTEVTIRRFVFSVV